MIPEKIYKKTFIICPNCGKITDAVREGKNTFKVTVGNTLVRDTQDRFSHFLLLAPSGLLGDIRLKYVR